jgi:hypothetical protein
VVGVEASMEKKRKEKKRKEKKRKEKKTREMGGERGPRVTCD